MRTIGLILALCLFAGCTRESTTPVSGEEEFNLAADQVGIYVRQHLTKDGIRQADVRADTALTFEESRQWDLIGVNMTFYNEAGRQVGTLTSREGNYDMASGLFIARGDVVLITQGEQGERRLETEELFYDVPGDRIWSDTPFTLTEGEQVSRGESFRSDSDFRTWEVTGGATQGPLGEEGIAF